MLFLTSNQQCQSTKGTNRLNKLNHKFKLPFKPTSTTRQKKNLKTVEIEATGLVIEIIVKLTEIGGKKFTTGYAV